MSQRTDEPTNQPTDQRTNQPTNQPTNRQKTCPLKPSHIFPLLDLLIFASLLAFSQICFSRSLRYSLTHLSMCIAEHRCWKLKLALRILEATILEPRSTILAMRRTRTTRQRNVVPTDEVAYGCYGFHHTRASRGDG